MNDLYERVAGERRRLREVRQMMTAAVERPGDDAEDYAPFYIAVGNYFEAAMHRLHEQDIRMGDMLTDKADLTIPKNKQAMSELDDRLRGNQTHLQKLLAARDDLQQHGAQALPEFKSAGKHYSDFIQANMGHHGGTNDMAQELFSADDWNYMAYISDDDLANEQRLYNEVVSLKPSDLVMPG